MLFKNIGIIDENFEYRENMYVGTNCHSIVYIDSKPPEDEEAFFETYDGKGKVLMPAFYNAGWRKRYFLSRTNCTAMQSTGQRCLPWLNP